MEAPSLQICEYSPRNEQLEQILRQMISKAVKELRAEYKAKKKQNAFGDELRPKLLVSIQRPDDADLSPVKYQRKQLGRKIKNPVTGEKVVRFSLPKDCDVLSIKDVDKVKERLGKWRIQRRQRNTKMNDTYYCHLSSRQIFRSVPEVLSFIMWEPQVRKPSRKRNKVENIMSREDQENFEEMSQNSLIIYEPQPKPIRKRSKVISEKAQEGKDKFEDTSSEVCLSICEPEAEPSQKIHDKVDMISELPLEKEREEKDKSLVDISSHESVENGVDSNLEISIFYMLWEMVFLPWEPDEHFSSLFPHANDKEIGNDLQALDRISEVNKRSQNLQENFEPEKIETLQDALEKLVHVQLEGVDEEDNMTPS